MSDPLPAGDFSAWVTELRGALRGQNDSNVPCDGCTACCTSSQFIHIEPDEADALAHIPVELTFPAPRLPRGHVLMGYDQRGHCPMLIDDRCSIYEHRPRTCRTYDCRVLAAADVNVDDSKPAIGLRAARWIFSHPTDADRQQHDGVRAAARFLDDHRAELADVDIDVPLDATPLAVMAVELHEAFVGCEQPAIEAVRVEVDLRRRARPAHRSDRPSAPPAASRPGSQRGPAGRV